MNLASCFLRDKAIRKIDFNFEARRTTYYYVEIHTTTLHLLPSWLGSRKIGASALIPTMTRQTDSPFSLVKKPVNRDKRPENKMIKSKVFVEEEALTRCVHLDKDNTAMPKYEKKEIAELLKQAKYEAELKQRQNEMKLQVKLKIMRETYRRVLDERAQNINLLKESVKITESAALSSRDTCTVYSSCAQMIEPNHKIAPFPTRRPKSSILKFLDEVMEASGKDVDKALDECKKKRTFDHVV